MKRSKLKSSTPSTSRSPTNHVSSSDRISWYYEECEEEDVVIFSPPSFSWGSLKSKPRSNSETGVFTSTTESPLKLVEFTSFDRHSEESAEFQYLN